MNTKHHRIPWLELFWLFVGAMLAWALLIELFLRAL
jgi:hypothetical protein